MHALDGNSMDLERLVEIADGLPVELSPYSVETVKRSREVVDRILRDKDVVYGVNTGFGNFSSVVIPRGKLAQLQVNLIRSHAAGVGADLDLRHCRA